jgi:hypothetical protein
MARILFQNPEIREKPELLHACLRVKREISFGKLVAKEH